MNNIKQLREQLGFTQQQMADKLGVSVSVVFKWEQGSRRPGRLAQRQIARLERKAARMEAK